MLHNVMENAWMRAAAGCPQEAQGAKAMMMPVHHRTPISSPEPSFDVQELRRLSAVVERLEVEVTSMKSDIQRLLAFVAEQRASESRMTNVGIATQEINRHMAGSLDILSRQHGNIQTALQQHAEGIATLSRRAKEQPQFGGHQRRQQQQQQQQQQHANAGREAMRKANLKGTSRNAGGERSPSALSNPGGSSPPSVASDDRYPCLFHDGEAPSVGGQGHPFKCRPCSFYCFGKKGCRNGQECRYCHQWHVTWSGREFREGALAAFAAGAGSSKPAGGAAPWPDQSQLAGVDAELEMTLSLSEASPGERQVPKSFLQNAADDVI